VELIALAPPLSPPSNGQARFKWSPAINMAVDLDLPLSF